MEALQLLFSTKINPGDYVINRRNRQGMEFDCMFKGIPRQVNWLGANITRNNKIMHLRFGVTFSNGHTGSFGISQVRKVSKRELKKKAIWIS